MPQIIVKGVSASRMEKLASPLIETVFRLVECPEDWVTVELCESKFFTKEGLTEQYPIIQIWWYERPQAVQDRVAKELSELFLKEGFSLVQISFHLFDKKDYSLKKGRLPAFNFLSTKKTSTQSYGCLWLPLSGSNRRPCG